MVGVDTGGTFTDLVAETPEGIRVAKVASTPDDPGRAVLEGLRVLGLAGVDVVHGTTVATNALLQRRGARVLLVTSDGFEDFAVIGRQDRSGLYDLGPKRGEPLFVAAVGAGGDPGQAARESKAEAIAVCLLESYRDGAAERRVRASLSGLGLPISLSSEVLCEFREFERASTTLADAFVRPVVAAYVRSLERRLAPGRLSVMLSGGGVASARRAAASPVETVLSGPAGGVLGAAQAARRCGIHRAISFDMGGTSTDVSAFGDDLPEATSIVVAGVPIALPCVEVETVGAGGGSVAHLDPGGALAVGPESAGAVPGPACYGLGGTAPTVTDAHVVLGHLGGRLAAGAGLDADAARRAVARLGAAVGRTAEETAAAILEVAAAAMERPIRRLTVERGLDPGRMTLVAFGGAGGLHACRLARALGIGAVLLPAHPGLLSALGMLGAPHRAQASRTVLERIDGASTERLAGVAQALTDEARRKLAGEGEARTVRVHVDLRFAGQSHELGVPLGGDLGAAFSEAHLRRYGFVLDRPIEAVTVRAVAEGARRPVALAAARPGGPDAASAIALWRETSLDARTPVYARDRLLAGMTLRGPAIVEELSATAIVERGWSATVQGSGDLLLTADTGTGP